MPGAGNSSPYGLASELDRSGKKALHLLSPCRQQALERPRPNPSPPVSQAHLSAS